MLYTRKEAAHQLSISIRSLDYLISSKQLNTRRIGSRILIPHEESSSGWPQAPASGQWPSSIPN
jgi:hypothetical protein